MLSPIAIAIDDLHGLRGKPPWHVRQLNDLVRQRKAAAYNSMREQQQALLRSMPHYSATMSQSLRMPPGF